MTLVCEHHWIIFFVVFENVCVYLIWLLFFRCLCMFMVLYCYLLCSFRFVIAFLCVFICWRNQNTVLECHTYLVLLSVNAFGLPSDFYGFWLMPIWHFILLILCGFIHVLFCVFFLLNFVCYIFGVLFD